MRTVTRALDADETDLLVEMVNSDAVSTPEELREVIGRNIQEMKKGYERERRIDFDLVDPERIFKTEEGYKLVYKPKAEGTFIHPVSISIRKSEIKNGRFSVVLDGYDPESGRKYIHINTADWKGFVSRNVVEWNANMSRYMECVLECSILSKKRMTEALTNLKNKMTMEKFRDTIIENLEGRLSPAISRAVMLEPKDAMLTDHTKPNVEIKNKIYNHAQFESIRKIPDIAWMQERAIAPENRLLGYDNTNMPVIRNLYNRYLGGEDVGKIADEAALHIENKVMQGKYHVLFEDIERAKPFIMEETLEESEKAEIEAFNVRVDKSRRIVIENGKSIRIYPFGSEWRRQDSFLLTEGMLRKYADQIAKQNGREKPDRRDTLYRIERQAQENLKKNKRICFVKDVAAYGRCDSPFADEVSFMLQPKCPGAIRITIKNGNVVDECLKDKKLAENYSAYWENGFYAVAPTLNDLFLIPKSLMPREQINEIMLSAKEEIRKDEPEFAKLYDTSMKSKDASVKIMGVLEYAPEKKGYVREDGEIALTWKEETARSVKEMKQTVKTLTNVQ